MPAGRRETWNPSHGCRRQTRWPSQPLATELMLSAEAAHESAPRLCLPSEGAQDKLGEPQSGEKFPGAAGPGGLAERDPPG